MLMITLNQIFVCFMNQIINTRYQCMEEQKVFLKLCVDFYSRIKLGKIKNVN